MSKMIPCRDTKKCGVQSHKPDTVTKCGLRASSSRTTHLGLSGGAPAPLSTPVDYRTDQETQEAELSLIHYDETFRNNQEAVHIQIGLVEHAFAFSGDEDVSVLAERSLEGKSNTPYGRGLREEALYKFAGIHPELNGDQVEDTVDLAVEVAALRISPDETIATEDGTEWTRGEYANNMRVNALARDANIREYSETSLIDPSRSDEMHERMVERLAELGVPEPDRESLAGDLPAKAESNMESLRRAVSERWPLAVLPEQEAFIAEP